MSQLQADVELNNRDTENGHRKEEAPKESGWKKHRDWKNRYTKLYGNKRVPKCQKQTNLFGPEAGVSFTSERLVTWAVCSKTNEEDEDGENWRRLSFMTNENTPYTALLMRVRANRRDTSSSISPSPRFLTSIMSQQSDLYGTYTGTGSMLSNQSVPPQSPEVRSKLSCDSSRRVSSDLGGHETLLLEMVRARSRQQQDSQDQTLDLFNEDNKSDGEACVHGLSIRMTERSVSRSRVSRMSTRRDMDIPSILAYTTTTTPSVHLGIPAFSKAAEPQKVDVPPWSIRRAVCPVCSQKWRDKSSISNIKYSGLKRNSSLELPSVIAPARLRTAITMEYEPRRAVAAIDQDAGVAHTAFRSSSATWQLTRARRFRAPKPLVPSPEATAPPVAAAPLAQRDLDIRVNRFLKDLEVKHTY